MSIKLHRRIEDHLLKFQNNVLFSPSFDLPFVYILQWRTGGGGISHFSLDLPYQISMLRVRHVVFENKKIGWHIFGVFYCVREYRIYYTPILGSSLRFWLLLPTSAISASAFWQCYATPHNRKKKILIF